MVKGDKKRGRFFGGEGFCVCIIIIKPTKISIIQTKIDLMRKKTKIYIYIICV